MRVHDLRHTCATLLVAQGVHPKVVQEILGHSQIGLTLDTYSHVLPHVNSEPPTEWIRPSVRSSRMAVTLPVNSAGAERSLAIRCVFLGKI
jgi:hypothetical protein